MQEIRMATPEEQRELRLQVFLHQIMLGLQAGLSGFYQREIRVAVILGLTNSDIPDQLRVYDLHGLLDGFQEIIERRFFATTNTLPSAGALQNEPHAQVVRISEQAISLEFRSNSIFQFWVVEVPVQNGSLEIAEKWALYAGRQLHNELLFEAAPVNVEFVLPSLGMPMVRLAIMEKLFGRNAQFELERVMEALVRICAMKEEGKLSFGRLSICDQQVDPSIPFKNPINISQTKHLRKLLKLSGDDAPLVCNGTSLVGLCTDVKILPLNRLDVFFRSGNAFLELEGEPLCRIYRDRFRCALIKIDRSFVKQFIPGGFTNRELLVHRVSTMADRVRDRGFGCTVVLDFDNSCDHLTGQDLVEPLALEPQNEEIIERMCGIDGAIVIDAQTQRVRSFGCLLDGKAVSNEDRSRGARHTSALRFSSEQPSVTIFVVSEDGPLSAYQSGQQHHETHSLKPCPSVHNDGPLLRNWLQGKRSAFANVYP